MFFRSPTPPDSRRQGRVVRRREDVLRALTICIRELLVARLDRERVDRARECKRHLILEIVDRSARIESDVEGLVERNQEGDAVRHRLAIDLLPIHAEHAGAALPRARPIVLEVEHDGVLPRRERDPLGRGERLVPRNVATVSRAASPVARTLSLGWTPS